MRPLPIVAPPTPDHRDSAGREHAPAAPALPDLRDEDLEPLLVAFYDVVGADPLLAPYFAPIDMPAHIPRIADFWSTLLFHSGRYQGNAFRPHQDMPGLEARHFVRWLATLESIVDARHAGPVADEMKSVAHRIAYSMQLRLGVAPFVVAPETP
jgi:hemoglobin